MVIAAAMVAGCAPKVKVDGASAFETDDPAAVDEPPALDAAPAPAVIRRRRGTVARRQLVRVLDAGIGAFLSAGVEVRPFFADKRFAGWEIVRFYPGDPRFAAVDLRPGDVVQSVNGQILERPRQAHEVWESLRTAPALVIRGARKGRAFELRYDITGKPAPAKTPARSP